MSNTALFRDYTAPSSEFQVLITVGNDSFRIFTAQTVSDNHSQTVETSFAIGTEGPVTISGVNQEFSVDLEIFRGEFEAMKKKFNVKTFLDFNSISNVNVEIYKVKKGAATPEYSYVYETFVFEDGGSGTISQNTTNSMVSLKGRGILKR
jgi:hypothetical protein